MQKLEFMRVHETKCFTLDYVHFQNIYYILGIRLFTCKNCVASLFFQLIKPMFDSIFEFFGLHLSNKRECVNKF